MTGTGVGPELVRLDDVNAGYGQHVVLRDVSFHIHEDQFTGIVGPSGAGKTTLLRCCWAPWAPVRHRLAPARISASPTCPSWRPSTGTSRSRCSSAC